MLPWALLLAAGCATRSEIRMLPSDTGTKAVYRSSPDRVRLACMDTAGELGFKIKEQTGAETDHTFIASQGLSSGSSGRYLRVRLARGDGDAGEMKVFVVVRSKVESKETAHTDALMEKDIQQRIAKRLEAK